MDVSGKTINNRRNEYHSVLRPLLGMEGEQRCRHINYSKYNPDIISQTCLTHGSLPFPRAYMLSHKALAILIDFRMVAHWQSSGPKCPERSTRKAQVHGGDHGKAPLLSRYPFPALSNYSCKLKLCHCTAL